MEKKSTARKEEYKLTEEKRMNQYLSHDHPNNSSGNPQDDLEQTPSIGWVACAHKSKAVSDDRDVALCAAVCHRVLCIDKEVAKRHKVCSEEACIRVLKVVTEVTLHVEGVETLTVCLVFTLCFGILWFKLVHLLVCGISILLIFGSIPLAS